MNKVFARLSIRTKLILLSGIPVVGALLLSWMIVRDARERALAAAALGSIEDVAHLSMQITNAVKAVQGERAQAALTEGMAARKNEDGSPRPSTAHVPVDEGYAETDRSLAGLESFLRGRDLTHLPPGLARDLYTARNKLEQRAAFRERLANEDVSVDDIVGYYSGINETLIHASAALSDLSDDGELLRNISSLVAMSRLTERSSREHALLAYVFGAGQFPPGAFKTLVTVMTEQQTYADVFHANASEAQLRGLEASQQGADAEVAQKMRAAALTTTDDAIEGDAETWFRTRGATIGTLHVLQAQSMDRIAASATAKASATRSRLRTGVGLSAFILAASIVLATMIGRGVQRSINDLGRAAKKVRETRDYSVRARKRSHDELGVLTDTFNEMLEGIQGRDHELETHRNNLEATVAERTAELTKRNEAMRVVLDNVDQGLVMIGKDGAVAGEHSQPIERWFGKPSVGVHFADLVSSGDATLSETMKMSWDMVIEDFLPRELTLAQLPHSLVRNGSHFTLGYKPIEHEGAVDGALLVVTDVTSEVEARKAQAIQRERVAIFEHIAADREGFAAFIEETSSLLGRLASAADLKAALAVAHTVKGGAACWGVTSLSEAAHELESRMLDAGEVPSAEEQAPVHEIWRGVVERAQGFLGAAAAHVDLSRDELDAFLDRVRRGVSQDELLRWLEQLKHESTAKCFQRSVAQIERVAAKLDKPMPTVKIEHNGVRLPPARFGHFWGAAVHVVRNLMDHGIEPAADRVAAGKAPAGRITMRSYVTSDRIVLEMADDGGGIDWETVRAKAAEKGLPHATEAELGKALFAAGFSTRTEVTDMSGRGVGLTAVADECAQLGGDVSVESKRGEGTCFRFTFPRQRTSRRPVQQHAVS